MLIRFAVENFLSFKDSTEFSMSAGKVTRHSNHVCEKNGKRILKGGFLFGANASGKTNFIRAVEFAKNIVKNGLHNISYDKKYFRIDNEYINKPGVFQFDFYASGHFYSYGFAISYLNSAIEEEWLYQIDANDKCIFLRSKVEGDTKLTSDVSFVDKAQFERFKVYSDDITSPKMEQTLFLSDVVLRSPDSEIEYQPFRDVSEWFKRLIIIFPNSKYGGIIKLMDDDIACKQIAELLNYFDTGIISVSSIERDLDKVISDIPKKTLETIKSELVKDSSIQIKIPRANTLIEVRIRDGNLYANEIVTDHGNNLDLFEFNDESDGTKRLFDLIPLYQSALRDHVILVDELDRSLHTKATIEFIKYFYTVANKHSAQLIATTHDSNIMDLDLLRQDEIWFVERQEDHSSRIYSLNKFKTRFDKKVEKDYLLGRYGAIPVFNQFSLIENEEGDTCEV